MRLLLASSAKQKRSTLLSRVVEAIIQVCFMVLCILLTFTLNVFAMEKVKDCNGDDNGDAARRSVSSMEK